MSGYLSACASEVLISRAQEILGWEGEKGKAGSQGQHTFFLLALMGRQEGMESSLRVFFLGGPTPSAVAKQKGSAPT